jgi:serine/threonine-protein kinase
MMARSGAFNIPTDYFDTKPSIANITAGTPAGKRKNWGLIAGVAGVVTAIAIVSVILSVGSSGNATTTTTSATAAPPPVSATATAPSATSAEPATPAPPAKPTKTVQVIAVPLEAEVFVNNEKVSRSPAVLQVPEGEKMTAEVRLDGYVTKEVVLDGKKTRVDVKLVKVPVKGSVKTGGGATDVRDPWAKKR